MKTLQESIIGKKGAPMKFTKDMLKPGYIVRYRDEELGMYFAPNNMSRIARLRKLYNQCEGEGCFICDISGGLRTEFDWMPVYKYDNDLKCVSGRRELDIIEIYPVKTTPQLLTRNGLEHLIKGVAPIKINQ